MTNLRQKKRQIIQSLIDIDSLKMVMLTFQKFQKMFGDGHFWELGHCFSSGSTPKFKCLKKCLLYRSFIQFLNCGRQTIFFKIELIF